MTLGNQNNIYYAPILALLTPTYRAPAAALAIIAIKT